jgi:FkbM family methyltransferase
MASGGDRPSGFWETLRWARGAHRLEPYRWSEVWTRRGREAHYRRWLEANHRQLTESIQRRGVRTPDSWTFHDLEHLREVMVEGCYDVDGFVPGPRDVVIDAGCEWGDFACLCARAGARVIAFDPNPENVARTLELLRTNGVTAEVHPVAVGRAAGKIRVGRLNDSMLSVATTADSREVSVWSLDALDLPRTNFVKIDVEGMEAEVLEGARALLARDRPRLIVEVHGRRATDATYRFLRAEGYQHVHDGPRKRMRDFGVGKDTFWVPARTAAA